jgi:hypothetical protein
MLWGRIADTSLSMHMDLTRTLNLHLAFYFVLHLHIYPGSSLIGYSFLHLISFIH